MPCTLRHARLSPHVWGSGLGLAAAVHLVAAHPAYPATTNEPDPPWVEYDVADNPLRDEILLVRRARITHVAISLCVLAALLVSVAIVVLFIGAYFEDLPVLSIALTFGGALTALIAALLCFLREVHLATSTLRITVN